MKTMGVEFPQIHIPEDETADRGTLVRSIMNLLVSLRNYIAEVVDYNSVLYFSQNGTPTTTDVLAGQMAVWKDADAASSSPTHYLVYNDGGTILTFSSEEVVP